MSRPDFPRTIFEFQQRFRADADCQDYLYRSRWPNGFVCPACGNRSAYFMQARHLYQCTRCRHQTSLTAGTVMHRSKIPICHWFYGAYLMTTQTPGMSALQFARQVGLPYETAYMMFQKLRAGMVNPERTPLVGPVEIDEAYIGGTRRGKAGRGAANKAIVVAAVEVRGNGKRAVAGRVRLRVVPDASANQLNRFIQDHVSQGSAFKTDEWKSYTLSQEHGYPHIAVPSDKGYGLPHVHRVFSNLKTWIKGTHHGVSKKHLQAYLNEYAFRFNRRKTPMAAFQTVLGIGSHVPGPTYRGIYDGQWHHHNP